MLMLYFVLIFIVGSVSAFIPEPCVSNATRPDGVCCPIFKGNGLMCGGPQRGECERIQPCQENIPEVYADDDRIAFPKKWFTYFCKCRPNYRGVDCGKCNYHLKGENCDRPKLCTRRNIMTLPQQEKKMFVDIFLASLTHPTNLYVVIEDSADYMDPARQVRLVKGNVHYVMSTTHRFCSRSTAFKDATECQTLGILDFNHGSCGFVAWHRMLGIQWEDFFAEIAKSRFQIDDYCVPYWNWISKDGCDICTNDLIGADGEMDQYGPRLHTDSPFHNFVEYCTEVPEEEGGSACQACHFNTQFGMLTRRKRAECVLPTVDEVAYCINSNLPFVLPGSVEEQNECSVSRCIEGSCGRPGTDSADLYVHNKVHNCFDGSMCCSATANTDPMFVLHHVAIDRIYSIIQRRRRFNREDVPSEGCRPGHGRECYMCGYIPTMKIGDVMGDSEHFGYQYDSYDINDL